VVNTVCGMRAAFRLLFVLVATAATLLLAACGGAEPAPDGGGHGFEHVHGLGINPADGALYIATHDGVFRSPQGPESVERVGEGTHDMMGFTVVGPDHFLASGHPGPGEPGPANLGLVASTDAGQSWQEVSLGGEADFHVLRFAHDRLYGYDATGGRLMVSEDHGASWSERRAPAYVIDLATDPEDPERIIASTERGLLLSDDDGRRWQALGSDDRIGLLAWPQEDRLYMIDAEGAVYVSGEAGRRWQRVGRIGGQPAALVAESDRKLIAALADGTVMRSTDGGAAWSVRA
jgi:photosystem II stability/assembly factor-like uncharacterized protein